MAFFIVTTAKTSNIACDFSPMKGVRDYNICFLSLAGGITLPRIHTPRIHTFLSTVHFPAVASLVMTLCRCADGYQHFRGTYYFLHFLCSLPKINTELHITVYIVWFGFKQNTV
jgi:hypothetical protein